MELETMWELARRMGVEIIHEDIRGDIQGMYIDDVIILDKKNGRYNKEMCAGGRNRPLLYCKRRYSSDKYCR